MAFEIILLFLMLIFTPYIAGSIVTRRFDGYGRRVDIAYITGFMIMLALFELIAVPVILNVKYGSFRMLSICFSASVIAVDVIGTYLWLKDRGLAGSGKNRLDVWRGSTAESSIPAGEIKKSSIGMRIMWIIVGAILLYMLYMAVTRSWFDGDDAYYVTQSVITQQTGTMYQIQPYTGGSTSLDLRHVMAAFTMWIAYMSTACGFHAAVFCHTVLPVFVIPLTELIYYEIAKKLFGRKHNDMVPIFMIFVMLFQIFGSTSIYTSETFLLTRTWQGKSMVANFIFPLMLWLWMEILDIGDDKSEKGVGNPAAVNDAKPAPWWVMLFMLSACAGIFSSLAVILCSAFSGLVALMFAVRRHSPRLIVNTLITFIPAVIYAAIFVLI